MKIPSHKREVSIFCYNILVLKNFKAHKAEVWEQIRKQMIIN
ncbi:Uncharacterized protein dnm_074640 [Desulfonema magnum]|uniref:Uncharacterized protein n=1 Tax=Desulfonema magnum TaxID=45655 RepID=A0A975BTU8_9BACT|nr:Uncharacterized protein dnm_074640 [Desulfonema magnum]